MKKLLVVGSNSIHTYNFILLVESYFDEVLLLTNQKNNNYQVNSIEVDFSLGLSSLRVMKQIKQVAHEYNPTTLHIQQANSYAFLTLMALDKYKCQKILTAWGSDVLINPKRSFLLKKMLQYSLSKVESVTADSNIVLEEAQAISKNKLDTHNINFGITPMQCTQNKENIIYSNRLHKNLYNIDKIIISFSKFIIEYKNWKLIIAGSGDETDKLKGMVHSLGLNENVEFIGWVDTEKNYEYYCRSKIYVSIPKSDSVSLSLVEGIISGCIPFVSNLAANQELVNSDLGFIVDDLENIPFEKYEEIDKELFEMKKKYVKKYFSKEFNRDKYISLYKRANEN